MFHVIKRYKPLYRRSNHITENVYEGVEVEEEEKDQDKLKTEKLLKIIEERRRSLEACVALLGDEDELTQNIYSELTGLEEAFEVVFGRTVVEYILMKEEKKRG